MKSKTYWFAISEFSYGKDIFNSQYNDIYLNDIFDSKKELITSIKRMKKYQPYRYNYNKLKIMKRVIKGMREDYGGPLGSWMYHPEKGLIFARSQWQGD